MTAENIISFIIFVLVAFVMFTIGIAQLLSKKPVGFYSGEKPPQAGDLTDVSAWNKKHGIMWILYGTAILFSYGILIFTGNSVWCTLLACGGLMFPVVIMIWYHNKLKKTYLK